MAYLQASLFEPSIDAPHRVDSTVDGLFREVPSFPHYDQISTGDLFALSLKSQDPTLTHGLHRFPAKYVPRIPGWVLEQFARPNDVVLDPFCGSGTTLVEAILRSRIAVGIDCDPLACLISRAKTSTVDPARIRTLGIALRQLKRDRSAILELPMPDLLNFNHWFTNEAWSDLQLLLNSIRRLEASQDEKEFLLCIFSSILRRASNADDQTQKTYVSGTLKKHPPAVLPLFYKTYDKAVQGLQQLAELRRPSSKVSVIRGNASNLELPPESVDLVVTSPPYLDSVDYMYNLMVEYFWLGPLLGVDDRRTFNRLRRGVIGAKAPIHDAFLPLPPSLDDLISESDIIEQRVPAVRAYCHSMAAHFRSAASALKRGSYYFLIVGNSQSRKGTLPIHDCLVRLAADAGFTFEKAFAYRIRRHYMKFPRAGRGGIITMDWVIALKNERGSGFHPERLPLPNFTLRGDEVAN